MNITEQPNVKIGDRIKVLNSPVLKVTQIYKGFPEKQHGGIQGLESTVKNSYSSEDLNDWWIEANGKYIYPAFSVEKSVMESITEDDEGYNDSKNAPVKIGDVVIDINKYNSKPGKVTDIKYGYPEELNAKYKPNEEFLKIHFSLPVARKMWWVVIDGFAAMPYGEDGVLKLDDAKKKGHIEENINESKYLLKDEPEKKNEAFAADGDKIGSIMDKVEKLPPEQKKMYDLMTPEQKKVFHSLVDAIKNPIKEANVNETIFTKTHYIAIGNILKMAKTKDEIINKLSEYFKKDNPLFDVMKFIQFIGIKPVTTTPKF